MKVCANCSKEITDEMDDVLAGMCEKCFEQVENQARLESRRKKRQRS